MLRTGIFLLALMSGGGAAWMSVGDFGAAPAATPYNDGGVAVQTVDVLVAANDLPSGSPVDAATLRWQPWPIDGLNAAFITRDQRPDAAADFSGQVARSALLAGEPISESKFTTGDSRALSVMLAPGRRAVAVRINAENSAGGLLLPNDRVDVFLTTSRSNSGGQNIVDSNLILRNVKVLAVDQVVDSSSDAVVGKTATLELTPPEVEIITAAEITGSLSLALRAIVDNGEESVVIVPEKRVLRIFRGGEMVVMELDET